LRNNLSQGRDKIQPRLYLSYPSREGLVNLSQGIVVSVYKSVFFSSLKRRTKKCAFFYSQGVDDYKVITKSSVDVLDIDAIQEISIEPPCLEKLRKPLLFRHK